ncbi:MAG TPA: hypothetical protein VGG14_08940 [Candidatus Sulfotelmatobacter sp.]
MKRLFRLVPVVMYLATFVAAVPFVAAQNAARSSTQFQANPASNDVVGARLIVWSEFQKPKPLVDGTQAAQTAKSDQETGRALKTASPPQDGGLEAGPQPGNSHSSSSNKVEPGGR